MKGQCVLRHRDRVEDRVPFRDDLPPRSAIGEKRIHFEDAKMRGAVVGANVKPVVCRMHVELGVDAFDERPKVQRSVRAIRQVHVGTRPAEVHGCDEPPAVARYGQ